MDAMTGDPAHGQWLDDQFRGLVDFSAGSLRPGGGFWYLDELGQPVPGRTPQLFLTARMVHVASLGVVRRIPGASRLLDHGMASLLDYFVDHEHGGWWSDPQRPGSKMTYDHVHVGLAASSAAAAGHPLAPALMALVVDVVETRLWDESTRTLRESFAPDWTEPEAYRGANANMHGVEAFLALGDTTGDPVWHERALDVADRLVNREARDRDWLLPEHFTGDWLAQPEYNHDQPEHPFRPYGATYGHLLEWARFLLALDASPVIPHVPWLVEAAEEMTRSALDRGWAADGAPGLVYTVDWQRMPVSALRLHWPVCEALQATAALGRVTRADHWDRWYDRLWTHARKYFIDDRGQWRNELDPQLRPSGTLWPGRPDVYHCAGAYVVAQLPLSPFMTLAAAGLPSRLVAHSARDDAPPATARI